MINRVVLVGRLTKDPVLSKTSNGTSVAKFTLAVNRPFVKQGEDKQADFIQCTVFGKNAENTTQYTRKGSLVGIDGRIQTGSYQKDGQTVYTTDVICDSVQFLESKKEQTPNYGQAHQQYQNNGYQAPAPNVTSGFNITDEDLPF